MKKLTAVISSIAMGAALCCRPGMITGPQLDNVVLHEPVHYSREAIDSVKAWYRSVQQDPVFPREFAACLRGYASPDGTTTVRVAERMRATHEEYDKINYDSRTCRTYPDVVGALHSHPEGYLCKPSPVDSNTTRLYAWMNVTAVACLDHDTLRINNFFRHNMK